LIALRWFEGAVAAWVRRRRTTGVRIGMAVVMLCLLPVGNGNAQFLFWPKLSSPWSNRSGLQPKHRHEHKAADVTKNSHPAEAPRTALQIIISITDQRLSLYDNGTLIAHSPVSTGVKGHPTPVGIFSVISKQRWHRSNIYSAAPMPYMQRITWSGIALHAGVVPGHPASHGCIRLPTKFAIRLWQLTGRGTRVIIARDEVEPVEITNSHLFAPKPKVEAHRPEPQPAAATANAGDASAPTDAVAVSSGSGTGEATQAPAPPPAASVTRKPRPITVFVSREMGKLFVRQGFAPVFDSPVTIMNSEEPLGTHVFTAVEVAGEGPEVRWNVVSMPEEHPGKSSRSAKGAERDPVSSPDNQVPQTSAPPTTAAAVLDRIMIPDDVIDRINELLTPGSSLVISDHRMSDETGRDTDFIVLTR